MHFLNRGWVGKGGFYFLEVVRLQCFSWGKVNFLSGGSVFTERGEVNLLNGGK